jgi:phosphopantothenoylcysteine decarboxylase/phosphopantothenate--cysteine ligase
MNVNMWEHPATQQNLKVLSERGVNVVEPGTGYLACGMVGAGRLAEPEQIVAAFADALRTAHDLEGESILITTGPTYESIDPVRFIGNRSSGKMGFALAQAALKRGARVVVIAGPTPLEPRVAPPSRAEIVRVTTAEQMRRAVMEHLPSSSIIIKAAAVADYRPKTQSAQKIKRGQPLTVELEPNPDILLEIVANRAPGQIVIGFAAETENVLENGRGKLERKKLDAIVVNDVSRPGIGFDSDRNAVTIITPSESIMVPEAPKSVIAERVLDTARELRRAGNIIRLVTAR